ncbi:MAG: DUF2513 domain-containing protein [Dinoroseobacter sp.]|nr:DUF2513 domain-containing protein [Dinoroseobacter sp.]
MQRDDDYIRSLLFEFVEQEDWLILVTDTLSSNKEDRKRRYHVLLLCDAGLMTQVGNSTFRLTSQGHDFVSALQDEGIWQKTKDAVAKTGGNATITIIQQLAVGYLKKKIETQTGVEL